MRRYASIAAAIGWISLVLRYLVGQNFETLSKTVVYFSYFSILANILATLMLTEAALLPPGGRRWLTRPAVASGSTLYMAVVGLATLPPPLWMLDQRLLICDSLLHYLMPILVLRFWLVYVPRGKLALWHLTVWLIFPVVYGIYLRFFGTPYIAFNAARLGTAQAMTNTALMAISFLAFGGSMLVTDRVLGEHAARTAQASAAQVGE
jgi:hypothetical protein